MSQCVKVAAGASLSQQNKLAFQRRHIKLRRQRAVKEPLRCDVKALPWRLLNIMATVIVCKKETRGACCTRCQRQRSHDSLVFDECTEFCCCRLCLWDGAVRPLLVCPGWVRLVPTSELPRNTRRLSAPDDTQRWHSRTRNTRKTGVGAAKRLTYGAAPPQAEPRVTARHLHRPLCLSKPLQTTGGN